MVLHRNFDGIEFISWGMSKKTKEEAEKEKRYIKKQNEGTKVRIIKMQSGEDKNRYMIFISKYLKEWNYKKPSHW